MDDLVSGDDNYPYMCPAVVGCRSTEHSVPVNRFTFLWWLCVRVGSSVFLTMVSHLKSPPTVPAAAMGTRADGLDACFPPSPVAQLVHPVARTRLVTSVLAVSTLLGPLGRGSNSPSWSTKPSWCRARQAFAPVRAQGEQSGGRR